MSYDASHANYSMLFYLLLENHFTSCDVFSAIKEAQMRTLDSLARKWLTRIMDTHAELVMYAVYAYLM